jgi:hypothetical protein
MNEPELGAGINPGMALNPILSGIWIRRDSNPQPLDCESSLLTTRPDLRPLKVLLRFIPSPMFRIIAVGSIDTFNVLYTRLVSQTKIS